MHELAVGRPFSTHHTVAAVVYGLKIAYAINCRQLMPLSEEYVPGSTPQSLYDNLSEPSSPPPIGLSASSGDAYGNLCSHCGLRRCAADYGVSGRCALCEAGGALADHGGSASRALGGDES